MREIRNSCYRNESRERPILMYAISLIVLEGGLIGDVFRVSEKDLLTYNFYVD